MGFKYQCVEFARRWLFHRKGLVLPDVGMASQIADLTEVFEATNATPVPMHKTMNGTTTKPTADSLLIFPVSHLSPWGHVAVITHVEDSCIYVADQNYHFSQWDCEKGLRLTLKKETAVSASGQAETLWRIIDDSASDINDHLEPCCWISFSDIPARDPAAPLPAVHPTLQCSPPPPMEWSRESFTPTKSTDNWLDLSNEAEKLFVEEFGLDISRSRLNEKKANYYLMNWEMYLRCVAYAVELHEFFVEATEEVLKDDKQLALFGIPEEFWPRLRRSFEKQRDVILTGRFDFAFQNATKRLVCFEYNADSASTLLECGRIQTKWGESIGLDETGTRVGGMYLERQLRQAWRSSGIKGHVHFCVDDDREEKYTALICLQNAEAVGLKGKLCCMFDEFHFDEAGKIRDSENVLVTTIWKTWMWESAISDLQKARAEGVRPGAGVPWRGTPQDKVRLCDLLLGPDENITVLEPFWKVIPSNKAILPIVYRNHMDHPAVLRSEYQLSDALKATGFAQKPIVGRVGRNVTLTDRNGAVAAKTEGNYGERNMMYQELFDLDENDGYYAILGAWVIGDSFGGLGVREDRTRVTGLESPFSSVRIGVPKGVALKDEKK